MPAKITVRGTSPACSKKTRCTSFRVSSWARSSRFSPAPFPLRWPLPFACDTDKGFCGIWLGIGVISGPRPVCCINSNLLPGVNTVRIAQPGVQVLELREHLAVILTKIIYADLIERLPRLHLNVLGSWFGL